MRQTKRWAVAGTALAALLTMTAIAGPSASADGTASREGAKVSFRSGGEVFTLSDTDCDGNPVYLNYSLADATAKRLDHDGGCDTSEVFDLDFAEDVKIEYRACVNIRLLPDKCSDWVTDRT